MDVEKNTRRFLRLRTYETIPYRVIVIVIVIVIAGASNNSESVIRGSVGGGVVARVPGPALSCRTPAPFWVSWGRREVKVGRGQRVGGRTLLVWQPIRWHEIMAVSVATEGHAGSWEFRPLGQW